MTLDLDKLRRAALFDRLLARAAADRRPPLTDDDREYLRDRAYDACKVTDDEAREEAETWRR